MTGAAPPLHESITSFERATIIAAAMLATLMQVLDTTIANVALPHMQTSLGATQETVNWVLTSYIVASAISIPITGWLADRVGRKRLFIWAVILFTASSLLCATAQSLEEMVTFRVIQGVSGAFILPLSQAIMFDINPPERHAKAMALFGGGVVIGPILGPVLGGWLTESFNWRWVFIVNLPIGVVATLMLMRFLPKTPISVRRFDLFGFALLALALGCFQMMLDRGQQLDWFESWEVWIEGGVALGAAWMFFVHLFTSREALFDPRMFVDRNFVTGLLFMVVMGLLLYGGLALLPPMLQKLMGYSVLDTGFLTAPRGVGTLMGMAAAGRLAGKVDARLLVFTGLTLMGVSLWMMAGFSLQMDSTPVVVSGVVQGMGLGLIFVPLNIIAFDTLATHYRTTAASLLTLCRSLGGSLGISLVTTLLARNLQTSHSDLAAHVTEATIPLADPGLVARLGMAGDSALAVVDAEINRQALMIAFIDDFHLMMIVTVAALPLLLLLRKSHRGGKAPVVIGE